MPQFKIEAYNKNKELFNMLQNIAKEKNATPVQISLAWMICKKNYIVPIPGTRKTDRLIENAGATEVNLSIDEVKNIDNILDKISMSDVYGGVKTTASK